MHLTIPLKIEKGRFSNNKNVYLMDGEGKVIMENNFISDWQYDLLEEMVNLFNNKIK